MLLSRYKSLADGEVILSETFNKLLLEDARNSRELVSCVRLSFHDFEIRFYTDAAKPVVFRSTLGQAVEFPAYAHGENQFHGYHDCEENEVYSLKSHVFSFCKGLRQLLSTVRAGRAKATHVPLGASSHHTRAECS